MSTYQPKAAEIERAWHVIDADGAILGRLATEVATILRGKNKVIWSPHVDCGDNVIIINAGKIEVTGAKRTEKRYWRHSGYPGGMKSRSFDEMIDKHPDRVIRQAIKGMLPKSRLGRRMIGKLHVYAGPTHPHHAQQPQPYALRARSS